MFYFKVVLFFNSVRSFQVDFLSIFEKNLELYLINPYMPSVP